MRYRGEKRRLSAVYQKETYIGDLALSFLRGDIVLLMSGICAAVMALQIRKRLLRSATHYSSGVTACLAGAGGGAGACSLNIWCIKIYWLGGCVGVGRGASLVLIPFHCAIVES